MGEPNTPDFPHLPSPRPTSSSSTLRPCLVSFRNPEGPRTQIRGFEGPNTINGIVALKPYYWGPWNPQGKAAGRSLLFSLLGLGKLRGAEIVSNGVTVPQTNLGGHE